MRDVEGEGYEDVVSRRRVQNQNEDNDDGGGRRRRRERMRWSWMKWSLARTTQVMRGWITIVPEK
eukprot:7776218-Pyramimonas_sp.AAC.1